MLSLIIGDTHFGSKSDNAAMLDYSLSYFERVVYPLVKERKIERIVHLGDFYDRRKYANFATLSAVRKSVIEPLSDLGVPVDIIAGNHDTYWRNASDVTSLEEVIGGKYPNIKFHIEPSSIDVGFRKPSLLLPWINSSNNDASLEAIAAAPKGTMVFSHLELNGFDVLPGVKFAGGMDPSTFSNLRVISGHFHHKQDAGNIIYVGTPYDLNFGDRMSTKGVHVLNSSENTLEFIPNDDKMFHQYVYDDRSDGFLVDQRTGAQVSPSSAVGKYLRIVVHAKTNPNLFDRVYGEASSSAGTLSVVEVLPTDDAPEKEAVADMSKGTIELIHDAIEGMDNIPDKDRLKRFMSELYVESISRDSAA